jgi:NADPH:quinone reductase-like Zn-dependent oxidoreductase
MKAIVLHEHGGIDKLKYEDYPEPEPGPGEVKVRVKACALNHLDLWVRQGLPTVAIPLPHIPGSDVSGVAAAVGTGVRHVAVGDEVVISPGVSCGHCEMCLSGQDNLCRYYAILGNTIDGGDAEYVKAPAVNILPKPKSLDFNEAAAVPLVFLTAYHMLVTRARLQPGEVVLVHAAGSGVGSAAVQVAKLWGARVIATAGTDAKLAKAKELGADDLINYSKQDFAEEVRRITGKKGVDVVVEHIGPETWEKSIIALARGGRLVTCGATTGPTARLDLRYLFSKHLAVLGSWMGTKAELIEVLKYFDSGRLHAVVDRVLPLKDAPLAHQLMMERAQFGKIVLNP